MYDLKTIIEANTVDGVVNYEKIMGSLDSDYVNPIVAKKTDKSKLLPEAVTEVIKGLGLENAESVEDLKLYIKKMGGSTDEAKEANILLDLKVKELEEKYNGEVEARTQLEKTSKYNSEIDTIKSLGITDKDSIDFLHFKLSKLVTDDKDFNAVVAEYAKENDVKTTTRFIKDEFGKASGAVDIGAAWKESRNRR